ncbi:unnamed protein product [Cladocopium goreaui]|uniref:MAP kinase-activated protein kinase 5 (MAPK-activated protein kinase 5) (MAPKAP kinase 5) (MAPKAP-K5) (MAPKAPK-5) (MK-5) (MK5) (p38-regulated/activated protein kinase) (PRAK) n=1 Tax=Cladocopium goreaui TaxID=2562237 RepID=A0A9P1G9D7_9DINO|nr:unnamed protein product [Cladocopium goreaui]
MLRDAQVLEAKEKQGYTAGASHLPDRSIRDIRDIRAACDLWSLGVVTYVMLCGKPPFWGNYNEQLRRMKRETFPMSDSTWQQISRPAKAQRSSFGASSEQIRNKGRDIESG